MEPSFSYQCKTCGETHSGMPALGADAPAYYYDLPEAEREARAYLDPDICVVDEEFYFLRSNLLVPVEGLSESLMWGVWASVSKASFDDYLEHYESPDRVSRGPYFGWLSSILYSYPDTQNLKMQVFPQEPGIRPRLVLEATEHPLSVEQRDGISQGRLAEIYGEYLHA